VSDGIHGKNLKKQDINSSDKELHDKIRERKKALKERELRGLKTMAIWGWYCVKGIV